MFPFPGPILALQSSYARAHEPGDEEAQYAADRERALTVPGHEQGYAAKSDQEGCAMDGGAGEAKEFDQCHGRS